MKSLLIALTIVTSGSVVAQYLRPSTGKNVVSGEFGMFHRGLIGASYLRLLVNQERFLLGTGGGLGMGGVFGGGGVNQFYYASCYLAGGGFRLDRYDDRDRLFISASIDLRYIDYHDSEYKTIGNETFSYELHYSVFNFAPYLGISFFTRSDNFIVQMRLPLLGFFDTNEKRTVEWGGVGLSAGFSF